MVEPSCVRGHGRRRARRTTVSPTLWTPFPFRPVHAWLVWCWPACVWSVYGQVAAAAAVLLVRGRLGRLMVGLVCVGSIALLPVVVPPHVVYAAGMSVSVLVSGVVVRPSVVLCSLLSLVGRVCIGSVVVFCCVRGHGRRRARPTTVSPTLWTPFPFQPVHAWLVWCWPACVWSVYGQVAAAAAVLLVRCRLGRLMVGLVCVGSIALLPVVVPPHVVYGAGMSVSVLVSGVVSVQVWCCVVCYRWLVAFVLAALWCSAVFVGMVVGGRGAPRCCQPVGRRSRFDPCMPGWFGVGRLACGLFTVKWWLQLWCGWCAVVVAVSWSAGFLWVPLRCCRWSYRRTLPI